MTIHSGVNLGDNYQDSRLVLRPGDSAFVTTLHDDTAELSVAGGVTSGTIINNGWENLTDKGSAFNTVIYKGRQTLEGGSYAFGTTIVSGGTQWVNNGSAANTVVERGYLHVSGGSAYISNTEIKSGGNLNIFESATVTNTTIESGGNLLIYKDAKIRGELHIAGRARFAYNGTAVADGTGATVVMHLEDRKPSDQAIFETSFTAIKNANFAVSVSPMMEEGSYRLADDISKFNTTITVRSVNGQEIGKLSLNEAIVWNNTTYKLQILPFGSSSNRTFSLVLTVQAGSHPEPGPIWVEEGGTMNVPSDAGFGSIGFYENYTDTFQLNIEKSGKYVIGDYDFGTLNGNFTITQTVNGKTKKVAEGKIKNGVVSLKETLLEAGDYTLTITNSDKGKTNAEYVFDFDATALFKDPSKDEDFNNLPNENKINIAEDNVSGWVGFGDKLDYYQVNFDVATKSTFNISTSDEIKVTFYTLSNGKLKSIKNVTVKANQTAQIKDILIESGSYYFGIESKNADKGGSADFEISLDDKTVFFTKGNNADDNFAQLDAGYSVTIGNKPDELISDEWVGWGDEFDYRKVTFADAGKYTFDVSSSDDIKFTIYELQSNGKLKSIKNITVKAGKTGQIKDYLLEAGTYYISVQSTNASKGGNADYDVSFNESSVVFTKGNNADDNFASLPTEYNVTVGDQAISLVSDEWVGFGDEYDYRKVTFETAGKYTFDVKATDAAKFTIYELQSNGKLKSIKNITIKAGQTVQLKDLMLESGTYYISMQSTNASKGGNADYSVDMNDSSVFFTKGNNADDNFAALPAEYTVTVGDQAVSLISSDWVGFGDEFDYRKVTFENAGKYTFDVKSSDAAKFTIYELQSNGKLKSIKNITIKAGQTVQLKDLMLESGTYYISMQSTNASKGGNADYSVNINNGSAFFTKGNNADDNFAALPAEYSVTVGDQAVSLISNEWVGFGDEFDYRKVTFENAGKYTFDVKSSDDAKFTIYELQSNGKLKSVKNITVKAGQTVQLKDLMLESGTYYISMQSTNASKGGNADYSVSINNGSAFFTKGNNADDNFAKLSQEYVVKVADQPMKIVSDEWVGFGDQIDYRIVSLENAGMYTFDITSSDAAKFTISTMDSKGKLKSVKNITIKAGQTVQLKDLLLDSGVYYISMESTNASKGGNASYSIGINSTTEFFTKGNNADDNVNALPDPYSFDIVDGRNIISTNEWVGYGDSVDWREIDIRKYGLCQITVSGVSDKVKLTIGELQDNGKIKSIKTLTVNSGSGTISLELDDDDYFIGVEASNASKGDGTNYSLEINFQSFADPHDLSAALEVSSMNLLLDDGAIDSLAIDSVMADFADNTTQDETNINKYSLLA